MSAFGLLRAALLGSVLVSAATFGLAACSGGSSDPAVETVAFELAPELVDQIWVVKVATNDALKPFIENKGWEQHTVRRDYRRAVEVFGSEPSLGSARAHADAADLHRQAALLAAHSIIETYGVTPEPGDPKGVAHLLAVSYAMTGDLAKAREESAKMEGLEDPATPWHAPWKAWLAGEAKWAPDLSTLPYALPPVQPGTWPSAGDQPTYRLPESGEGAHEREMGDPGILVALAEWHRQAAEAAAPDQKVALATYMSRYHLPVEGAVAETAELPPELLFGSDYAVSADAAFMAAVLGAQGISAIEAFQDKSVLAKIAAASRVNGKINAQQATDVLAKFRETLVNASKAKTAGEGLAHHTMFADIAKVGAMRSLALVAEVDGDREEAGKLRLGAKDAGDKAAADPSGLMALAAWDAHNRYPLRGLDIIHQLSRQHDTLETARYALDVLALRVGRQTAGQ